MDELTRRVVANARRRGLVVLTHQQWGSQHQPLYRERLTSRPVTVEKADTLWQHITVTFDSGNLIGDFKKDMRTLERIGIERFGTGVSYNFCVDHVSGMVGLGQFLLAKGSHTINDKKISGYSRDQNAVARAVAWIGMPGMKPTRKARRAMAILMAAMIEEGALTDHLDYEPHSLVAYKDCPTDAARDIMPWIKTKGLEWAKIPSADFAVRLRPEVTALRKAIAEFLSKPRLLFVRVALLAADEALAKIERKRN